MSATIYTVTHPTAGYSGTITVKGFTMTFAARTYTGPVPDSVVSELQRIGYTATAQSAQEPPTILGGTGVPTAATGSDGAFYFRLDGAAGAAIYQRRAGSWVAVA